MNENKDYEELEIFGKSFELNQKLEKKQKHNEKPIDPRDIFQGKVTKQKGKSYRKSDVDKKKSEKLNYDL